MRKQTAEKLIGSAEEEAKRIVKSAEDEGENRKKEKVLEAKERLLSFDEQVTEYLEFEKPVIIDGNTKFIDVYIPSTKVIIEQKSGDNTAKLRE